MGQAVGLRARQLLTGALLALSAACDAATSVEPGLPPPAATPNPIAGATFWVDPSSPARQTATAWRASRPADAAQMDKIASQGIAKWFGSWTSNIRAEADAATSTMIAAGAMPVFVAYNLPKHNCGGSPSITAEAYRSWITGFADGIGTRRAVVILEPDALAEMDCLSAADQQVRLDLVKFAVQTFASKGGIYVYIDAGSRGWKSAATMAPRLVSAGVASAQGFAVNVANFQFTSESVVFGTQLSALLGGKHFVVDTGRNGRGPSPDGQVCNPAGRALGERPTTATGNALVDAYLWVKTPGESDGTCAGGTSVQAWMPEYALGLAQRASY